MQCTVPGLDFNQGQRSIRGASKLWKGQMEKAKFNSNRFPKRKKRNIYPSVSRVFFFLKDGGGRREREKNKFSPS